MIFLHPVTAGGHRLRFLTDTGGGYFLLAQAARSAELFQGETPESLPFPRWSDGAGIPAPEPAVIPIWEPEGEHAGDPASSGMLGAAWFAGRDWHIDYSRERFSHLTLWNPDALELSRAVPLHFQKDDSGLPTTSFPRVDVEIDSEELSLLFDTGAQVALTDAAFAELADGLPRVRATSFIVASIFDRWRRRHPDWRVVEGADAMVKGEPMILVPSVRVGDCATGPAWFTRRPDPNFTEYMSKWMDRPVAGALGGSALAAFDVTLSYPREFVVLQQRTSTGSMPPAKCGIPGLESRRPSPIRSETATGWASA